MLIHGMVFNVASHWVPVPAATTATDLDLSLFVDSPIAQPVAGPLSEADMGEASPRSMEPASRVDTAPQPGMAAPITTPVSSTRSPPHLPAAKGAPHPKRPLDHQIKTVRRGLGSPVKPENTAKAYPDLRQRNQRETLKLPAASPFVDDRPSRDSAQADNPTAPRSQDLSRNQDEHDLFGLGFRASTGTNPKIDTRPGVDQRSVSGVKGSPSRVGQTKAGGATGASTAGRASAERAYLAELQRAIGRYQRFPEEARRSRRTGVVAISFVILADGRLQQLAIAQSSGFSDLDRAALEALSRLGRFKPIPPEIGRGQWAIRVPIRFDLLSP